MEQGLVDGVADRAQVVLLVRRRVGEQVQRLVGMSGDDDPVVRRDLARRGAHLDAVVVADHRGHGLCRGARRAGARPAGRRTSPSRR